MAGSREHTSAAYLDSIELVLLKHGRSSRFSFFSRLDRREIVSRYFFVLIRYWIHFRNCSWMQFTHAMKFFLFCSSPLDQDFCALSLCMCACVKVIFVLFPRKSVLLKYAIDLISSKYLCISLLITWREIIMSNILFYFQSLLTSSILKIPLLVISTIWLHNLFN